MKHARLLYAHRGAAIELPENTMPAVERAAQLGVDAIETEVHLTRDGHVVISHDATASRMTGRNVAWGKLDLHEARALDLGWGFTTPDGDHPFLGRGIKISTLEEVLTQFPTMRFNVDLKQRTPSLVDPVLSLLRRLRAEERVTLASFDVRTLIDVRRRGYGGETAMSQPEVIAFLATPAVLYRQLPFTGTAAQVPMHAGPLHLDRPGFIDKCHQLGIRFDFWTINQPADATRLLSLGADGIMTDDPAAILPVFRAADGA